MSSELIQHALIMAAGRGNRMRPLTDVLPKPLVAYKGDTLIGNSLKSLTGQVAHIHVTVGYKKATLSEYLMTRGGVDSIINTEGYGNAWWIQHTLLQYVDEPILVLTTDNITELDLSFFSSEYQRLGSPACMLIPVQPVPGVDGDYIEHDDGMVISLQRLQPKEMYCSGIQVLNPKSIYRYIEDDFDDFSIVWERLICMRKLLVSQVYPKHWFSIDTLEQLLGAENIGMADNK